MFSKLVIGKIHRHLRMETIDIHRRGGLSHCCSLGQCSHFKERHSFFMFTELKTLQRPLLLWRLSKLSMFVRLLELRAYSGTSCPIFLWSFDRVVSPLHSVGSSEAMQHFRSSFGTVNECLHEFFLTGLPSLLRCSELFVILTMHSSISDELPSLIHMKAP